MRYGLYLGYNAKPWQGIYDVSSTPAYDLGTFFDDENGNRFRYALSNASLTPGAIVQSAPLAGATTTLQSACPVTVQSAATDLNIFCNAVTTQQAANLYAEGMAAIWRAGGNIVITRRVRSNSVLAISGTTSFITLYEPPGVVLTTSDRIALTANPYRNVVLLPTSVTGMALGGVHATVSSGQYMWVQTRGWFGFMVKDATTNVGAVPLARAGSTAGTLVNAAESDTAAVYKQVVGISNALWLDESAGICYLTCE